MGPRGSASGGKECYVRRSSRLLGLWLLVLLLGAMSPLSGATAHPDSSELHTIGKIRHLPPTAESKPTPIHVRAVVTYYDSVAPNLFVQDATGGIWVDLRESKAPHPLPGQLLDLKGAVGAGFTPYIAKPEWTLIGTSTPPKPVRLTYEQAITGTYDGDWIEMDGVVRSFVQEVEGSVLVMDVATPTGSFKVRVPDYHDPFPMYLVDAKVRFHGVCGAAFNRRNQLVAIHLLVPRLKDLEIVDPAPTDPFSVETTPIDSIRRFSADLPDVHRVKVIGTVTARFPQQGLFLMDSTGGLYAESQDGTPVDAGDEVEVIGFPAVGSYSPVLKSATIRPLRKHFEITPSSVAGRVALRGGYDAQLVSIKGTVQSHRQHLNQRLLVVESDDHVTFEASMAARGDSKWLAPPGSRVALTGICTVKADENGNPSEFQIVLRTPADVKVLSTPSWLTARHALSAVSILVALTFSVLGWVAILRRRVRRQTEIIQLKLENEAALEERYRRIFERNLTGLYVAHEDGSIIDCNDACARILGFSSREQLLANRGQAERIVRQFHGQSQESSSIVNVERSFVRPDGSSGWILSNARLVQPNNEGSSIIEGALVDITDRKLADQRIQFLAYYDSLTGLPNRMLLQDRLAKAIANAKRHREKIAVLFLDVDRFKTINDSLGHSYGDQLLQQLAIRLQACAREQDTVARLGGDEFLITLGSITEASDAAVVAERVAQEVMTEFSIQGLVLNVTGSIGISLFPDHGEDVETLIKNADAAMYASKENGRNTFRFFSEEMNAQAIERLKLESSLRAALDKQQLFLMYQPEVDVATGAVTCWEALLRWRHPELGLVSPDKFIRVAENSGMIIPIGEWVLRTACAQARQWHDQENIEVPVAVNVSAVQFRQEGFCDLVRRVLEETRLEPQYLELELTESLLLSNADVMFRVLGELKSMGVRLAIDDFGTGYSSLSYLKQFPVSKIKIDRSFIRDLAENADDGAITTAIINMSKCLNLRVTAEGVENQRQFWLLRAHGCDEVQGYFFSQPVTADQVVNRSYEISPASNRLATMGN